jgi:hypothetical protein
MRTTFTGETILHTASDADAVYVLSRHVRGGIGSGAADLWLRRWGAGGGSLEWEHHVSTTGAALGSSKDCQLQRTPAGRVLSACGGVLTVALSAASGASLEIRE